MKKFILAVLLCFALASTASAQVVDVRVGGGFRRPFFDPRFHDPRAFFAPFAPVRSYYTPPVNFAPFATYSQPQFLPGYAPAPSCSQQQQYGTNAYFAPLQPSTTTIIVR